MKDLTPRVLTPRVQRDPEGSAGVDHNVDPGQ